MKGGAILILLLACLVVAGGAEVAAPSSRPTAPEAAAKLVTRNVHWSRTSIGGLLVFGEVVNRGPADAANVGVLVELFGPGNARVARGATLRISTNVLRPAATGVWLAQMSNNPRAWKRMKVTAGEQIGAEEALKQNYTGFRVHGMKIEPLNPGFSQRVTGVVTNTGAKPAKVGAVMVALYNGARLVWVADQGFLYPYSTAQVPPRKSAPFQAPVTGYTKKPGRMVTHVRASTKGPGGFYLP
jgi:hypothetical protein